MIYIFWDNSNIFIPAKYVANRKDGQMLEQSVRIQFEALYKLAKAGREVEKAICVGSVPPELESVWTRLRRAGVEVELYERGAASGQEQAVDQALQVHMLRSLADRAGRPGVAVLLTGDGAGYDDGAGFHADLERMHNAGWGIELLSWDAACRNSLKSWAESVGVYVPLDNFYDSITFIQGGRRSSVLSLRNRQMAQPKSGA